MAELMSLALTAAPRIAMGMARLPACTHTHTQRISPYHWPRLAQPQARHPACVDPDPAMPFCRIHTRTHTPTPADLLPPPCLLTSAGNSTLAALMGSTAVVHAMSIVSMPHGHSACAALAVSTPAHTSSCAGTAHTCRLTSACASVLYPPALPTHVPVPQPASHTVTPSKPPSSSTHFSTFSTVCAWPLRMSSCTLLTSSVWP